MQALELATVETILGTKRLDQFQATTAGDVGPNLSL